jgi:hypothetical protein
MEIEPHPEVKSYIFNIEPVIEVDLNLEGDLNMEVDFNFTLKHLIFDLLYRLT